MIPCQTSRAALRTRHLRRGRIGSLGVALLLLLGGPAGADMRVNSGGGSSAAAALYDNGSGSTLTIDWNNGTAQKWKANAAACTLNTPSNPVENSTYTFLLEQDGTGSRCTTFTASWIKWPNNNTAPTLTTTASHTDLISLRYLNSMYLGIWTLDFTVQP